MSSICATFPFSLTLEISKHPRTRVLSLPSRRQNELRYPQYLSKNKPAPEQWGRGTRVTSSSLSSYAGEQQRDKAFLFPQKTKGWPMITYDDYWRFTRFSALRDSRMSSMEHVVSKRKVGWSFVSEVHVENSVQLFEVLLRKKYGMFIFKWKY